jgi:hypothetical protein
MYKPWFRAIIFILISGVILIYLTVGLNFFIYLNWYKSPEAWTAVGTIFLGLSAVVVALLSEWFKSLHKPKLIPASTNIIEQQTYLKLIRLTVKNSSYICANSVEANITKKRDPDGLLPKYIPLPLFWTHSQLQKNPLYRDIYPQQECNLDIANLIIPADAPPLLQLALSAGREISKWSIIKPGITYIVLELNEKRGAFLKADIEINWNGTRDDPKITIIDFSN